ncbi:MAG TPA: response regulator [Labilithrix sp.]|nr:response regulator [Labilithrix sp.]
MDILVVDDVRTDREIVGRVVTGAGHRVIYAENGVEAIAKAKQLQPGLIFMDVVMPEKTGFEATRELKRDPDTSAIPVVLVTTKGTDSDRFWGKRQGADDHVAKPFTADMLIQIIRRYTR